MIVKINLDLGMELIFLIMRGTHSGSRRTAILLVLGLALDRVHRHQRTSAARPHDGVVQPRGQSRPVGEPAGLVDVRRRGHLLPRRASGPSAPSSASGSSATSANPCGSRAANRSNHPRCDPSAESSPRSRATRRPSSPTRRCVGSSRRSPTCLPWEPAPAASDPGFSYQSDDPGIVVFYELADVISVDYRYTCQGRPDFGSVTTWAKMGGGILGCEGSQPAAPTDIADVIADVRTIACPPA